MTQHPLNANRIYPIGMQEKYNKGFFFMVGFHRKPYHSAFIGKSVCFSCISVLPKISDCSSHHLQSTVFLHGWLREREKRMSQPSPNSSVQAGTRTRVTSLSPPNSLYKATAPPPLFMPCSVDTLSPPLHPLHLGKTLV